MADRFLQRVSDVAERTAARLRELQDTLYECGLTAQAKDLDALIDEQMSIAFEHHEDTGVRPLPDAKFKR